MLPAKAQKVDFSKLSEEEKAQFRKYGRLPANKNVLTQRMKERKYFDSGDYALSKAGKTEQAVGEKHPSPESIPHHPTMTAPPPMGMSPSTTVTIPAINTAQPNPLLSPSGLSPPTEHHYHPLNVGEHPPGRPSFERRVSQPSGLQYRTKE